MKALQRRFQMFGSQLHNMISEFFPRWFCARSQFKFSLLSLSKKRAMTCTPAMWNDSQEFVFRDFSMYNVKLTKDQSRGQRDGTGDQAFPCLVLNATNSGYPHSHNCCHPTPLPSLAWGRSGREQSWAQSQDQPMSTTPTTCGLQLQLPSHPAQPAWLSQKADVSVLFLFFSILKVLLLVVFWLCFQRAMLKNSFNQ